MMLSIQLAMFDQSKNLDAPAKYAELK